MNARADVERKIRGLLEDERLAVLATEQGGQPYTSLLAFAGTADLKTILFGTSRNTRKFANLTANPRVALLITNGRNHQSDLSAASAVTATGLAAAVQGAGADALKALFLGRHPGLKAFLSDPSTELVRVQVERYVWVSRFQDVFDYRVDAE